MSAAAAVARGRRKAEALMTDRCTLSAAATDGDLNATTGNYDTIPGAQRYSGRCRVKPDDTQDREVDAGERMISQRAFVVSLPMAVADAQVNDVVEITASVLDPALADTVLRVVDVAKGTHLTARRLVCEEQTS